MPEGLRRVLTAVHRESQEIVVVVDRAESVCVKKPNDRKDDRRGDNRDKVPTRSHRHADGKREEDKARVARLLDDRAEADNGECAQEPEGDGEVIPDDHHDDGREHAHDDERKGEVLRVRKAAVRFAVDIDNRERESERQKKVKKDGGNAELSGSA